MEINEFLAIDGSHKRALALLVLIRSDRLSEGRFGMNQFSMFYDAVTAMPEEDPRRRFVEEAVRAFPIQEVTGEEFVGFLFFIQITKINPQVYEPKFRNLLKNGEVAGRTKAEILRHLSYSQPFSEAELDAETQVREHFPWIWIDCLVMTKWERIPEAVCRQLAMEGKAHNLLFRLPSWNKRVGRDEVWRCVNYWMILLPSPEEKSKLSRSADNLPYERGIISVD